MKETKQRYKIVKENSFSNIYYLYISMYGMGKILGIILTILLLSTSAIIGFITKNFVIDTLVYAISFGSFIYNYVLINIFYQSHKSGIFNEGYNGIYYNHCKKAFGPITILGKFFEIYTPLMICLIVPNLAVKILLSIAFIALNIVFKVKHNFVESKISSIVKNNLPIQVIMLCLGLFLSIQTVVVINVYNNLILIFLMLIMGLLKNILNKKLQNFIVKQNPKAKRRDPIDIYSLSKVFNLNIRKIGEKTEEEIELEKSEKMKSRALTEEEERKKRIAKANLILDDKAYGREVSAKHAQRDKLNEKKQLEKEKLKSLERKNASGKALTKEESYKIKEIESEKNKVELINKGTSRAKIKR